MKTKFTLALIAATVLLAGCWQKSVYPFFKEKDVFYEEKLIGTWREEKPDDPTTWKIVKGESPNSYNIHIESKDVKLDCDGRLFKMADVKMLDLYSRNRGIVDMPAHTLFRVKEIGESLKIQMLSPNWMKTRLQLHPKEIANVFTPNPEHPDDVEQGEFVLTASTDDVQKYITAHMNDEGFWEEPGELKKVK